MKRMHYLIVALILLVGALTFGIIGLIQFRAQPEPTEITSYGIMPFYVSTFGYGTAYNDEQGNPDETLLMRYVEYRSEDGRFSFLREVSAEEYSDFEIARENEAEHRATYRYVYTYYLDGELIPIIQEQELSDNQIREIAGATGRATIWQYLAFAGLLLIAGGYFLFLALRKKKKKPIDSDDVVIQ